MNKNKKLKAVGKYNVKFLISPIFHFLAYGGNICVATGVETDKLQWWKVDLKHISWIKEVSYKFLLD